MFFYEVRKKLVSKVLAGAMLLGLLSTSALATSVDIIIPVGESFDSVGTFNYNDIAMVKDADGYRYVTVEDGKLVPATVDSATPSTDLYAAQDATTGLWGYNDAEDGSGTMVIPAVYDEVAVEYMRSWFDLYVAKENGTWGVYERDTTNAGVTGIAAAIYDSDNFYDAVKIQGADGKYGLVWLQHWDGKDYLTVPMEYDDLLGDDWISDVNINGNAYWVQSGSTVSVVGSLWTSEGEVFTTFFTMDAKYYQSQKDDEGNWQEETSFYGNDTLVICDTTVDGSKYGIIQLDGTMLVDFIYDDISSLGMGMYSVRNYDVSYNCAMMSGDGVLVTGYDYGYFQSFNDLGRIAVAEADTYMLGLMGIDGTMVTDGFPYYNLYECSEGMWTAYNDAGVIALMNSDGQLVTDFLYNRVSWFNDGLIAVATLNYLGEGSYGLVDTRGDEVLPCVYDAIGSFDGAYASVYDMGYYDYNWIGQLDDAGTMQYGVIQKNYSIDMVPQATTLVVNGVSTTVNAYATLDSDGNPTNYYKIRDIAYLLNGTSAQFSVDWYGSVYLTSGMDYTANGSEMLTPFSGNRVGNDENVDTIVNNQWTELDTITLTDDEGGGYTYYKLRDLGNVLGFTVGWDSATSSITITTN